MTGIDGQLLETREIAAGDAIVTPAELTDDITRGKDGARGADHRLPTDAPVAGFYRLQLLARSKLGGLETRGAQHTVAEMAGAMADAAHVEAFHVERIETAAEYEFRAAAADVHHQAHVGIVIETMGHAEIDQARFLVPADDIDAMTEQGLGLVQKCGGVARLAQGVGADHAYRLARQAAHPLAELSKAFKCARDGLVVELVVGAQAGAEPHHVAHAIDHPEMIAGGMRNNHVKTVGTEIDRRDRRRTGVAHGSLGRKRCR